MCEQVCKTHYNLSKWQQFLMFVPTLGQHFTLMFGPQKVMRLLLSQPGSSSFPLAGAPDPRLGHPLLLSLPAPRQHRQLHIPAAPSNPGGDDQWADGEAEVLLHLQDVPATSDLTLQRLRQLCG